MPVNYCYDYLYDKESKEEVLKYVKSYKRTEPLKVEIIDNGIILPRIPASDPTIWMGLGGVIDRNNNFVELSGIKHVLGKGLVFGGAYEYDSKTIVENGSTVLYIGCLFDHWGHFLVDFITRLWYYIRNGKITIAYCGGGGFEKNRLYGSYKRFFELLGIDEKDMIDVRVPTKFNRIIIPEQSYLRNNYNTDEYKEIIDYVCGNIEAANMKAYKKVYFSRSKFIKRFKWHLERGEEAIEKTFKKNGYAVMDPIDMPLDEQIFYVRNADVFAGITSSNTINSVFAREGSDRIYIKKCYKMESESLHMDYITNAGNVTIIDGFILPYRKYRPGLSQGPHLLGMTNMLQKFIWDNKMEMLSSSYYTKEKLLSLFWIISAWGYNGLYRIYYKTFRKLIK